MLNKGNQLPKYLINSLDLDPSWIQLQIKNDKKIMYDYGIATDAIRNGKYRGNSLKQRLKMSAVKSEFIDCFLFKFLYKKKIIVDIIVSLVKEYWINFNILDSKRKDEVLSLNLYKEAYGEDKGYQIWLYFTKKGSSRFQGLGQQFFETTRRPPYIIVLGKNELLPEKNINA